jgi:hypothetical protein
MRLANTQHTRPHPTSTNHDATPRAAATNNTTATSNNSTTSTAIHRVYPTTPTPTHRDHNTERHCIQ